MASTARTPSLSQIRRGLQATSSVMLKTYLQYQGLVAGVNDSKENVIRRIEKYLASGDLDATVLFEDVVRFQEYNNKRVYLYNVSPAAIRAFDPRTLPEQVPDLTDVSFSGPFPSPVVVYSQYDVANARVVFAETHKRAVADYARGVIRSVNVTKVICLAIERDSGFITLSYDAPEQISPHGGHLAYYRYYRGIAEQLIGMPIVEFQIGGALMKLERSNLVHIPHGRRITIDGRVDLTSDGDDYRDMGAYARFDADVIAQERGRYIWLADDTGKNGSPALIRDVPTEMFAKTSLVRFTKDCLENEVEHIISQIRAHA